MGKDMCCVCNSCEDLVLIHDDHYFCENCVFEMKASEEVIICPVCDEDITTLVYDEYSTDNEEERYEPDSSDCGSE